MQDVTELYTSNEYIQKNPTLHAEDTPWKLTKILPAIDAILERIDKPEITLLDVGGGAGLILRAVAEHIESQGHNVRKIALDLSPGMLEVQKSNNPDAKTLNEDIRHTSLSDGEIDIALIIDVIEHVPGPDAAINELQRIAHYAVFNIPLEDALYLRCRNWLSGGRIRQQITASNGHINIYNSESAKSQVGGSILCSEISSSAAYYIMFQRSVLARAWYSVMVAAHKISPRIFVSSITLAADLPPKI